MHDAADEGRVRIVRCDEVDLPPPPVPANDGPAPQGPGKQALGEPETSQPSDLKERGYKLPQIQIIQKPTNTRRVGGL